MSDSDKHVATVWKIDPWYWSYGLTDNDRAFYRNHVAKAIGK